MLEPRFTKLYTYAESHSKTSQAARQFLLMARIFQMSNSVLISNEKSGLWVAANKLEKEMMAPMIGDAMRHDEGKEE